MAFPTNPSTNTVHDNNGRVWVFNGYAWERLTDILVHHTISVTGPSYSANFNDYYIGVSYNGTAGIILPENPITGTVIIVKDESGHAGDPYKYIVIRGASYAHKIDNSDSAIININNGAIDLIYRNGWRII
jgi:hypothetical protein